MNYLHSTLESFKLQWNLDEMPACPVGIELLYAFSKSVEGASFYTALEADEHGLPVAAEVQRNPFWVAYEKHFAHCMDCNEI
jgi:hypothetical protein